MKPKLCDDIKDDPTLILQDVLLKSLMSRVTATLEGSLRAGGSTTRYTIHKIKHLCNWFLAVFKNFENAAIAKNNLIIGKENKEVTSFCICFLSVIVSFIWDFLSSWSTLEMSLILVLAVHSLRPPLTAFTRRTRALKNRRQMTLASRAPARRN